MTDLSERSVNTAAVVRLSRSSSDVSATFVLRRLFSAGLALGACLRLTDDVSGARLARIIDELDAIGANVRRNAAAEDQTPACGDEGDTAWRPLVAETAKLVGQLTDHIEVLCRPGVVDRMADIHLVGAVQNLQQALMYLEAADRSNGPVRTGSGRLNL